MHAQLRASDGDRQQAIDALTSHTVAGRLTLDEFAERADAVYRSRTLAELAAVTADLPGTTTNRITRPCMATSALTSTALLLILLLGAVLLTAGTSWASMDTMMASMSTATGCR